MVPNRSKEIFRVALSRLLDTPDEVSRLEVLTAFCQGVAMEAKRQERDAILALVRAWVGCTVEGRELLRVIEMRGGQER